MLYLTCFKNLHTPQNGFISFSSWFSFPLSCSQTVNKETDIIVPNNYGLLKQSKMHDKICCCVHLELIFREKGEGLFYTLAAINGKGSADPFCWVDLSKWFDSGECYSQLYFLIYLFYQNIGFTIKRNIWNLNTILAGEEPGCTSSDRTMVQDAFFDWYRESEQKSGVYGLPGFGAADDRWV